MLSIFAKLSLVTTSIAPILLTLWFSEISKGWSSDKNFIVNISRCNGISYLIITVILTVICLGLIGLSRKKLEQVPVKITTVKTVDREIVGFIFVYLLPLINENTTSVNIPKLIFVGMLFFLIIATSHAYHFNPLLGVIGYHFYEVEIEGGITYVLISKQNIADCKSIAQVVQLTEYMILEL